MARDDPCRRAGLPRAAARARRRRPGVEPGLLQGFPQQRIFDRRRPAAAHSRARAAVPTKPAVYYGYSPANDEEEQMLVGPVRGKFTIEEALRRLLRPTGLTFSWTNSKTISIVRPPPPPPKLQPPPQVKRPRTFSASGGLSHAHEPRPDKMEEVITSASLIQPFGVPAAPFLILDRDDIETHGRQHDFGSAEVPDAAAVPAAGRLPQQRRTVCRAARSRSRYDDGADQRSSCVRRVPPVSPPTRST